MLQDFLSGVEAADPTNSSSAHHHRRPPHLSSSFGVRKPPAKKWKRSLEPPPAQPKIFRVEPRGFRQLVQKLTGATPPPSTPPKSFRDAPPPPLELGVGMKQQGLPEMMMAATAGDQDVLRSSVSPFREHSSLMSPLCGGGGQQQQMLSPTLFSAYLTWAAAATTASNPAVGP